MTQKKSVKTIVMAKRCLWLFTGRSTRLLGTSSFSIDNKLVYYPRYYNEYALDLEDLTDMFEINKFLGNPGVDTIFSIVRIQQ